MSKLEAKSQISECENIRRIYQNIVRKIGQKNDDLVKVNNDWREAALQKLSAANDVQRALLAGALQELVRQKQRLKAEIRTLDSDRNEVQNEYNLTKCPAMTGSIG